MKSIAQVSFPGGGLFLPAKTPYERQVLFEYVDQYTKRHGRVRFSLNRRECTVTVSDQPPTQCAVCDQRLDHLTYSLAGRRLCRYCVSQDLA